MNIKIYKLLYTKHTVNNNPAPNALKIVFQRDCDGVSIVVLVWGETKKALDEQDVVLATVHMNLNV